MDQTRNIELQPVKPEKDGAKLGTGDSAGENAPIMPLFRNT